MKRYLVVAAVLGGFILAATREAQALADPLGFVRAYQVSCATTATLIQPASGKKGMNSMRVWNNSATPVYLGGADVTTTTLGYPICTDTAVCPEAAISLDANEVVRCRVGSGTVTVTVLAGAK